MAGLCALRNDVCVFSIRHERAGQTGRKLSLPKRRERGTRVISNRQEGAAQLESSPKPSEERKRRESERGRGDYVGRERGKVDEGGSSKSRAGATAW